MIHVIYNVIYITIILLMFWWLVKAYHFANKKHKELNTYKDTIKVPYELFSHYEQAYVKFYRWMVDNHFPQETINKYDEIFKKED
jgi:hypothetical protein